MSRLLPNWSHRAVVRKWLMRKQYLYYDSGFWSESFNNYIPPHPQDACSMFEYASCMGFPLGATWLHCEAFKILWSHSEPLQVLYPSYSFFGISLQWKINTIDLKVVFVLCRNSKKILLPLKDNVKCTRFKSSWQLNTLLQFLVFYFLIQEVNRWLQNNNIKGWHHNIELQWSCWMVTV